MAKGKIAPAFYIEEKWENVVIAIRAGIPVGGVFWNFLTRERLEDIGTLPIDKDQMLMKEGMRQFCRTLQDIAASED